MSSADVPAGRDLDAMTRGFDSLRNELVAPLLGSDLSCPGCWSWLTPPHSFCMNCTAARQALDSVCEPIVPLTLYRRPSAMRDVFRRYKPNDEALEPQAADVLVLLLDTALEEAATEMTTAFGPIDRLAIVPSTRGQVAHPLQSIVDRVRSQGRHLPPTLTLRRGPAPLGHGIYDSQGFEAPSEAKGARVLLLDDVLTTGSRIHSAAAALAGAGSTVVGGLVLGRRVNPDFNTSAQAFWEQASSRPFDWDQLRQLLMVRARSS